MNRSEMKVNIQIYNGSFDSKSATYSEISEAVDKVCGYLPVDSVIMGYNAENDCYNRLRSFLGSRGVGLYLWFPVFSELGRLREFKPVLDFRGNELPGGLFQKEELFQFSCPQSSENLDKVFEVYEENFREAEIDGVFLDRIRYPSFSNGLASIFTCFCDDCICAMRKYGLDPDELIQELESIFSNRDRPIVREPIVLTRYLNFEYGFQKPIFRKFFEFRNHVIHQSLKQMYNYFTNKHLKVGLDVFAPSLGWLVGQDIKLIADCCDFIKPMYYLRTWAPAGLPMEVDALSSLAVFEAFTVNGKPGKEQLSRGILENTLGDLAGLAGLNVHAQVYPGLELNRIKGVADADPAYVEESMERFCKAGIKGVVLSWDILRAPEDNLKAVCDFFEG